MHTRLTWSQQGKMMTRKVPAQNVEQIKALTASYRQYRRQQRDLAQLQKEIKEIITQLQACITEQTRKPFRFLSLSPKMSANSASTRRKLPLKKMS